MVVLYKRTMLSSGLKGLCLTSKEYNMDIILCDQHYTVLAQKVSMSSVMIDEETCKTSSCTYWQSSCLFLFKLFSMEHTELNIHTVLDSGLVRFGLVTLFHGFDTQSCTYVPYLTQVQSGSDQSHCSMDSPPPHNTSGPPLTADFQSHYLLESGVELSRLLQIPLYLLEKNW